MADFPVQEFFNRSAVDSSTPKGTHLYQRAVNRALAPKFFR